MNDYTFDFSILTARDYLTIVRLGTEQPWTKVQLVQFLEMVQKTYAEFDDLPLYEIESLMAAFVKALDAHLQTMSIVEKFLGGLGDG